MDKLSLLKSVFVFAGLEENLLSQITGHMKEARFGAGQEIFSEGDKADSFFIIDSGDVTIAKKLGPGHEKVLAVLTQGNVFGEMAFFSDSPRTANAVSKSDSVLLKIERDEFMQFVSAQPHAGLRILSGLLQVSMDRLEQTSRELATIYQTSKIISSGKNLQNILKETSDELLLAIPGADNAALFLYNRFNEEYDAVVAPEGIKELARKCSLVCSLAQHPSGMLVNDTASLREPLEEFLRASKSFLLAPIVKNDTLLGLVALWNSAAPNAFKNSHLLLLSSVAGQLAEAIENIQYQQEERDRQRLNDAKQEY